MVGIRSHLSDHPIPALGSYYQNQKNCIMKPVIFLRLLTSALLVFMIVVTVCTSLESNLFEEWNSLVAIPWMRATLYDFFTNVIILLIWVWYRERNVIIKLLWTILFITMGSMGSCIYVLVALFQMNANESLLKLFAKRR